MSSNKKKKSHFLKNLRDKVRGRNDTKSSTSKPSVGSSAKKDKKYDNSSRGNAQKSSSIISSSYNPSVPPTVDELLNQLPSIREVKEPEEKRRLFIQKLRLCSYTFDFNKEAQKKEAEAREMKRRMLVELIDHLSSSKIWVSEQSLKAILHMIACNLFRPLPPSLYNDFDPDEDEPTHDPAWYDLSHAYSH